MAKDVGSYFNCTARERAVFEAGIKLGALFHQFIGIPVNTKNVKDVEKGMEAAVSVQPFVHDVHVKIDRKLLRKGEYTLDYTALDPKMLTVVLEIKYEDVLVRAKLDYIDELDYPLMYITEIEEL